MPRERTNQRSKSWMFTMNNPTVPFDKLPGLFTDGEDDVEYAAWQLECGEEGTMHVQGWVHFERVKSLAQVRQIIPRSHLERRKGSPAQARAYVMKAETRQAGPWEVGTCPGGQGTRSDWTSVKEFIREGLEAGGEKDDILLDLFELFPAKVATNARAVDKMFDMVKRQILRAAVAIDKSAGILPPPEVFVFWGPTGSGKTRRAWEEAGPMAWSKPGGQWFDGYEGQAAVILDEWPDLSMSINMVLQVLDRHRLMVPVKGGFREWCPRRIYITSNVPPSEWYPDADQGHRDALARRIREFGTKFHMDSVPGADGSGAAGSVDRCNSTDMICPSSQEDTEELNPYRVVEDGYEMF